MVILCVFGKGKKSILIFSTYPSILLYQSFGNWRRMSNLPPAIFIRQLHAEKRFYRSKSEKMTFPTNSHRAPFGVPGHLDGNRCCVCCVRKQHMLPKIVDLVKEGLSSLKIFWGVWGHLGRSEISFLSRGSKKGPFPRSTYTRLGGSPIF